METTIPLGHPKVTLVEEMQGLHGSISISELSLQKIWLHKDFLHSNLASHSNKKVQVIHPGYWNRFDGADFKDAEIVIDGQKFFGDIEIHFHPNDWFNHGHCYNPSFSKVILHVTLFEPNPLHTPVFNSLGFCPETLVLLPYLRQSLEEYALEEALLNFENRNNIEFLQAFLNKPESELKEILLENAYLRWKQKYAFALNRLKTESWENVCHQMFLEALGYRRNRSPMNIIALQYPLNYIVQNKISADELFLSQKENWKLAKLRPANHPLKRLTQYVELLQKNPNWPRSWTHYADKLSSENCSKTTASYRKDYKLSRFHSEIKEDILFNAVSGTRLNTIIIDVLLPLAGAYLNKDFFYLWFHWFTGDMPSSIASFLDPISFFSKKQPECNGINQAILQLFIQTRFI
ncbi:MAG: hypothetical protein C5B43_00320 [Verrucomicrobia bacterium]|nr:MAG: hypothetical protein C5B43_00320 [Verrucomicrobiota bacterium]